MSDANNLRYYIQSQDPPQEALKSFTKPGGFSGTDINAMWRIKKLTELFGPCGIGWYTEITRREILEFDAINKKCFVDINLYIRDPFTHEWSKPITGTGGNDWVSKQKRKGVDTIIINDECYKMAETDALGSACKKLGFGASVYWEQDKTKYTIDENGNYTETVVSPEEIKKENRKKAAEAFGMNNTEAEVSKEDPAQEEVNFRKAAECRKAINDWVSEDPLVNAGHEVLASYSERFGTIDQWNAGTCIQCYKELKNAKVQGLKEVAL